MKRDLLYFCKLFFGCILHSTKNVAVVPIEDNNACQKTMYGRISKKFNPMDINGRPLIAEKKEKFADEYFKQLTISWH